MYPIKQYRVEIHCPLRDAEEEVFFHEVKSGSKFYAIFDGCDHQYSDCPECSACQTLAYEKLTSSADAPRT